MEKHSFSRTFHPSVYFAQLDYFADKHGPSCDEIGPEFPIGLFQFQAQFALWWNDRPVFFEVSYAIKGVDVDR